MASSPIVTSDSLRDVVHTRHPNDAAPEPDAEPAPAITIPELERLAPAGPTIPDAPEVNIVASDMPIKGAAQESLYLREA